MKRIFYMSGPNINVEKGYWLYDQLANDGYEVKSYYLYKIGHRKDFSTKIHSYTRALKLLLDSNKDDKILLYDITSSFILVGLLIYVLKIKRDVVAVNFMGSGSSCGYSKWKRPIIRMALKRMKVGVNSEKLIDIYSKELGLGKDNFFIVKDCVENVDTRIRDFKSENPPYIFTGGNVHRDWNLYKQVVQECPQYRFVAVLSTSELDDVADLPNLKICKLIPLAEFNELVRNCKVVFLPLVTEIQGGLLVAFQGSMYKKPIIVTHGLSIDTYYSDKDVIKVKKGDLKSCISALQTLMNSDEKCIALAESGYKRISQLSPNMIYSIIKSQFAE